LTTALCVFWVTASDYPFGLFNLYVVFVCIHQPYTFVIQKRVEVGVTWHYVSYHCTW